EQVDVSGAVDGDHGDRHVLDEGVQVARLLFLGRTRLAKTLQHALERVCQLAEGSRGLLRRKGLREVRMLDHEQETAEVPVRALNVAQKRCHLHAQHNHAEEDVRTSKYAATTQTNRISVTWMTTLSRKCL